MGKRKVDTWLTEDGLTQIRRWARHDLTNAEIAERMEINTATLYDWKNKYPTIDDALKRVREICVGEVEDALERAAVGYYVTEEEWQNKWNPKSKEFELLLSKRKKVWIKPDTTAQIFYLKNRDRKRWRDKQDIELEAEHGGNVCIVPKREIIDEEDTKQEEKEK